MLLGSKYSYFNADDSDEEIRVGNVSSDEEEEEINDDGQVRMSVLQQ